MNAMEFRLAVMTLAQRHRFSETSGLRTAKRNKAVGGNKNSRHLLGLAVDVVLDDMGKGPREALIADARRMGLVAVYEGDHIHLQG